MDKKAKNNFIIFSVIVYIIGIAGMIAGSICDIKIDLALFNPENSISRIAESFGQFVYWGIWGSAFAILFLSRRNLQECLEVISKVFPFIKPVKNTDTKLYKLFDFIVKALSAAAFLILSAIGWKKLIENVTKNILLEMGKDDLSQFFYFIISGVVAVISILIFSKINKQTLRKLEAVALAGILLGICYKIVEECKNITSRVRFREMVAYSNGFLNEEGLSEGKHSPLTRSMAENTDFSAFTNWYKKGDDMGIYNRADSFPSGHTTYACTTFLSVIFCSAFEKLKKLTPLAFCFSIAYTAGMAVTRLVTGAHYLTDVAGALLIGYTIFVIVYSIYNRFVEKKIIG